MRAVNPGTFLFCALVTLCCGIFTMWFVWDCLDVYESACTAPLSGPLWLIVPLWVGFYLLLGAAFSLMLEGRLPHLDRSSAVWHWLLLLLLSFLQAAVFFRLEYLRITFALGALTLALCLSATSLFARSNRASGLLMLLCTAWQGYLCYLEFTAAAGI